MKYETKVLTTKYQKADAYGHDGTERRRAEHRSLEASEDLLEDIKTVIK